MKRIIERLLFLVLIIAGAKCVFAQVDYTDQSRTMPFKVSSNTPGACRAYEFYYNPVTARMYKCDDVIPNKWNDFSDVRWPAANPSGGVCTGTEKYVQVYAGVIYTCQSLTWQSTTPPPVPTPVPTPGTTITLTAPRGYAICTGTCTVAVPVPAAGYEFCVLNGDNVATAITLSALGSGAMYESTARTSYGTAGTGTFTATAAAANKVCLLGLDSTHYLTLSFAGTWTAN